MQTCDEHQHIKSRRKLADTKNKFHFIARISSFHFHFRLFFCCSFASTVCCVCWWCSSLMWTYNRKSQQNMCLEYFIQPWNTAETRVMSSSFSCYCRGKKERKKRAKNMKNSNRLDVTKWKTFENEEFLLYQKETHNLLGKQRRRYVKFVAWYVQRSHKRGKTFDYYSCFFFHAHIQHNSFLSLFTLWEFFYFSTSFSRSPTTRPHWVELSSSFVARDTRASATRFFILITKPPSSRFRGNNHYDDDDEINFHR